MRVRENARAKWADGRSSPGRSFDARVTMSRSRGARLCRAGDSRSEAGAVIILALVYLVAIGLTVAALASWSTNDLRNTGNFNATSELHYAVSSATNTAIQSIRYSPLPSSTPPQKLATPTPPGNCWTPTGGATRSQVIINGYTVDVWCSTYEDLTNSSTLTLTRTVTFYACLNTFTAAQCQSTPKLKAVVAFDDYPTSGGVQLTVQCNLGVGQCGYDQTLITWIWG